MAPEGVEWRSVIVDDRLRQVVQSGLDNNGDLRISTLNVVRARALYRVQDSTRFPEVDLVDSRTRTMTKASKQTQGSLQVSLPAYEVDLFGRVHNLADSAMQSYLASTEAARAARIALISEIASVWLAIGFDASASRCATALMEIERRRYELSVRARELGMGGAAAVALAEARLKASEEGVISAKSRAVQDRNALRLLLGAEPRDDLLPLEGLPTHANVMLAIPDAIPAQVLLQRPDVLSAEHLLQARYYDIGAARAAFFPTISINAAIGLAQDRFYRRPTGENLFQTFGGGMSLPLLDGGARAAGLDGAFADRDIAMATYERTVQRAYEEAADALASHSEFAQRLSALEVEKAAIGKSQADATVAFQKGASGYANVLAAQADQLNAALAVDEMAFLEESARISIFQSFGGAWGH